MPRTSKPPTPPMIIRSLEAVAKWAALSHDAKVWLGKSNKDGKIADTIPPLVYYELLAAGFVGVDRTIKEPD